MEIAIILIVLFIVGMIISGFKLIFWPIRLVLSLVLFLVNNVLPLILMPLAKLTGRAIGNVNAIKTLKGHDNKLEILRKINSNEPIEGESK